MVAAGYLIHALIVNREGDAQEAIQLGLESLSHSKLGYGTHSGSIEANIGAFMLKEGDTSQSISYCEKAISHLYHDIFNAERLILDDRTVHLKVE